MTLANYTVCMQHREPHSPGDLWEMQEKSEIEVGISRLREKKGYIKMQSNIVQLFDFKLHADNDWLLHELYKQTHTDALGSVTWLP